MIPKFLGAVVAILLAFGVFYYFNFAGVKDVLNTNVPVNNSFGGDNSSSQEENINNFNECVAAGNKPLPDAPDKCLTKAGHLFIQGVEE